MTKIFAGLSVGLMALAVTFAWGEDAEPKASDKLPQPVVDTHELMEIFNEQLHEDLHAALQTEPATPRAWKLLARQGYKAAEIANLVAMRAPEDQHADAWRKLSVEAQQSGVNLANAAKKQDWKAAQTAYQAIIKNCNACHQTIDPKHEHAPILEP